MRYLFIGAHTDEELCFGGTIAKLVDQGHEVDVAAFSSGSANIAEWERSLKIIGGYPYHYPSLLNDDSFQSISDDLYTVRGNYDFVFTHDALDRHPLHKTVAEASKRVFNCNLLTYIGAWNGTMKENYFVELSAQQLETKIEALACYKSQSHRSYMNPDFIRAQARYNGLKCSKLFAEGFKVERLVF